MSVFKHTCMHTHTHACTHRLTHSTYLLTAITGFGLAIQIQGLLEFSGIVEPSLHKTLTSLQASVPV